MRILGALWGATLCAALVACGTGPTPIAREKVSADGKVEAAALAAEIPDLIQRGELEAAVERSDRIDQTDPYSPRNAMAIARARAALAARDGNPRPYHDAMLRADAAVEAAPDDAELRFQRGLLQFDRKYFSRALEDFERAVELQPDLIEARRYIGFTRRHLRQPKLERKAFEELVRVAPNDADGRYFLGAVLLRSSDAADRAVGEESLKQAIAIEPTHRLALQALAFLEHGRGEFGPAEQHLRAALAVASAEADTVRALPPPPGPPRPPSQLVDEDEPAPLHPELETESEILYSLGVVLQAAGKNQEAAEAYERCLTIQPSHPRGAGNLGVVLLALGDVDQGLRRLREAADREEDKDVVKRIELMIDEVEAGVAAETAAEAAAATAPSPAPAPAAEPTSPPPVDGAR
jgi:tetratricopeptide (TPR) repeat protein